MWTVNCFTFWLAPPVLGNPMILVSGAMLLPLKSKYDPVATLIIS